MLHLILTVSKGWVTVTAPHAAMPPAMKALVCNVLAKAPRGYDKLKPYPVVVAIENKEETLRSPVELLGVFKSSSHPLCCYCKIVIIPPGPKMALGRNSRNK